MTTALHALQRSSWLKRARPLDYEWKPGDIDYDLWHAIIDTFGFPSWIRRYMDLAAPLPVTTEAMCAHTFMDWMPIAHFDYGTQMGWDMSPTQPVARNTYDLYYGFYAEDLDGDWPRIRTDSSYHTGYSLGRVITTRVPRNLYL